MTFLTEHKKAFGNLPDDIINKITNLLDLEPSDFTRIETHLYWSHKISKCIGEFVIMYNFIEKDNFIEKCTSMNKNVLVHCHAGVSRSATILIAYFMRKNKISYQEAFDFVKSKRSIIGPNFDFRDALRNYKPTY